MNHPSGPSCHLSGRRSSSQHPLSVDDFASRNKTAPLRRAPPVRRRLSMLMAVQILPKVSSCVGGYRLAISNGMHAGMSAQRPVRLSVAEPVVTLLPGTPRAITTVGRRFPVFGRPLDNGVMVEAAAVGLGALRSVRPGWVMVGDDASAAPSGFWADREGLGRG